VLHCLQLTLENVDIHDLSEMQMEELIGKEGMLFPVEDISGKVT